MVMWYPASSSFPNMNCQTIFQTTIFWRTSRSSRYRLEIHVPSFQVKESAKAAGFQAPDYVFIRLHRPISSIHSCQHLRLIIALQYSSVKSVAVRITVDWKYEVKKEIRKDKRSQAIGNQTRCSLSSIRYQWLRNHTESQTVWECSNALVWTAWAEGDRQASLGLV